jgi:outer membrane lipoprotein SlyB
MDNQLFTMRQNMLLKHKNAIVAGILLFIVALVVSCASSRSGSVYSRDQARQTQTVSAGVVTHVRSVLIEGTKTPIGTAAGGAIGGVAGSAVGGGVGRDLMTVAGAIAGGVAGAAAEEGITRKDGLEITVKLDSGSIIAVVQEADENFVTGERVSVLKSGDGTTRVTH